MDGPVIFSGVGVKPVKWISSPEDAPLLGGNSTISCRLFDEDMGQPAVLEVEESDENLRAIGGEDELPGVHWSNMLEIQNGRRVAVRPIKITHSDQISLQVHVAYDL